LKVLSPPHKVTSTLALKDLEWYAKEQQKLKGTPSYEKVGRLIEELAGILCGLEDIEKETTK